MNNSDLIVILGASDNPMRPSFMANKILTNKGFKTLNITYQKENTEDMEVPVFDEEGKTITIFLKPNQQKQYYNYMLSLKPSRIIFNPGTENDELKALASQNNIKVVSGCTIALIMNRLL